MFDLERDTTLEVPISRCLALPDRGRNMTLLHQRLQSNSNPLKRRFLDRNLKMLAICISPKNRNDTIERFEEKTVRIEASCIKMKEICIY